MKALELFAGLNHSFSRVAKKHGIECTTLDINGKADINTDILTLNYKKLWKPGDFDIVWASPPCQTFSQCRRSWIGRQMKMFGTTIITAEILDEDMENRGVPILKKTEEIIKYLNPSFYFIENPASGKMKKYITHFTNHYKVDYCSYGYDYRKTTSIWCNLPGFEPLRCGGIGYCDKIDENGEHKKTLGGRKGSFSLKQKYSIPPKLIEQILIFCGVVV